MKAASITVDAVTAWLDADPAQVTIARLALTVDDPTAAFRQARSPWFRGDGKIRFMGWTDTTFPAGLVWRVRAALIEAGSPAPIITWPDRSTGIPSFEMLNIELRAYQVAAVKKALRAGRVCLQCPTSSGKTEIGIEIARQVARPTLWIVQSDQLLQETRDRWMRRTGFAPGIAQGATFSDGEIIIGMVQSLVKRASPEIKRPRKRPIPNPQYDPKYFARFGLVIVDEAHHAGADSYQKVLRACVSATRRVGLSGTMKTSDVATDYRIEGALGPTHVVTTTSALVEQGFVARPRVTLLQPSDASYPGYEKVRDLVCPTWRDNPRQLVTLGTELFRVTYDAGIVNNMERNALVLGTAHRHASAGDKFLILVNRLDHAEDLAQKYPVVSYPFWVLNGESTDRTEVIDEFREAKRGAVLIATPFFREGIDLPQIDAGFLAGGGESDIAVWQALSRMLRKRPGKDYVDIYDITDGPRDADIRHEKDYLANHADTRVDLFRRMGCDIRKA